MPTCRQPHLVIVRVLSFELRNTSLLLHQSLCPCSDQVLLQTRQLRQATAILIVCLHTYTGRNGLTVQLKRHDAAYYYYTLPDRSGKLQYWT